MEGFDISSKGAFDRSAVQLLHLLARQPGEDTRSRAVEQLQDSITGLRLAATALDTEFDYESCGNIAKAADSLENLAPRNGSFLFQLASCYSDEVIILKEGRVLANGKTEDVISESLVAEAFDVDSS